MMTIRETYADGIRGILRLQRDMPGVMTVREMQSMLGLHEHKGLTIGELTTEQVHPKRLLAELAEEFDATR